MLGGMRQGGKKYRSPLGGLEAAQVSKPAGSPISQSAGLQHGRVRVALMSRWYFESLKSFFSRNTQHGPLTLNIFHQSSAICHSPLILPHSTSFYLILLIS